MRLRLLRTLALPALTGLALAACQPGYEDDTDDLGEEPVVEAPAAEDAAVDVVEDEATEEPATAPVDTGDMGEPKSSEESVQPDSETLFY